MGSSSVWGDIRGFTVMEYVRSHDSGIFRRWWAKVVSPLQIHHYHSFGNQVFEDSVHHCLKGGQTICQSKEHYKWLIEAPVGSEGCLPCISIFHPYIVKPPVYVELSKLLSSLQLIDEFGNQWKWIFIFDGDHF